MILMAFNNPHKPLTGAFVTIVTSTAKVVHHMTIARRQKVQLCSYAVYVLFQATSEEMIKTVYTELAKNFQASIKPSVIAFTCSNF